MTESNTSASYLPLRLSIWMDCQFRTSLFRAQEPKASMTYCDHTLSGIRRPSVRPSIVRRPSVRLFTFSTFLSRTAWWILLKLGMDEVLMVHYKCCCFFDQMRPGADPGRGKIWSKGGPVLYKTFFFRPEGYSNKPIAKQVSRSIWEEVLLFLVSFGIQIFDAFWRLFGLCHFGVC